MFLILRDLRNLSHYLTMEICFRTNKVQIIRLQTYIMTSMKLFDSDIKLRQQADNTVFRKLCLGNSVSLRI